MNINDNINIAKNLAYLICNKTIDYSYGSNEHLNQSHQSTTTIYVKDWISAIHEIAHWIAADPKYRNLHNLGLAYEHDDNDYRMLYEETIALFITKMLFDKYAYNPSYIEKAFSVVYTHADAFTFTGLLKLDADLTENKAKILFNQYTNDLSKRLIYQKSNIKLPLHLLMSEVYD